jgi:hypothetical protein
MTHLRSFGKTTAENDNLMSAGIAIRHVYNFTSDWFLLPIQNPLPSENSQILFE